MTLALAVALCVAITLPHVLRLDDAPPVAGAAIWLSALVLRALTAVAIALFVVVMLPTTSAFSAVTHWCWHTVVPLLTAHLGLDGHRMGDAAVVLPAFVLAGSLISVGFGVLVAARRLRTQLARAALGAGPEDTLMVGGEDVVVAVAGLRWPRVVVSTGALIALDDEELAAGLAHERGHIARRHRFVLLLATLLQALGRFLPGTRSAARELAYHLERDADNWAVSRRHDPFALASAICKAATAAVGTGAVATALGGGSTRRRVERLAGRPLPAARRRAGAAVLAVGMVALTLFSVAALPFAATEARGAASAELRHCRA